jgi:vacuolar-type H+-ATPase subunit E/Vma4
MPKTKEEVAKIARSAAIKKYKSYSVEKLDAEIERIKNKKTKSAKDMIDWSVLKGLKKRQTEKPQTLPTLSSIV